jgi:hypothetical protein
MTPSDYAQKELQLWEQALQEQRQAEEQLQNARDKGAWARTRELLPQVHALSTRADLLLAEAVKVKCMFRDHTIKGVWASTTQSGDVEHPEG